DVQFHQKVRANGGVEGLRHVRDLQPGGTPRHPSDIDLHDGAGMPFEVLAEMHVSVEALADRDGKTGVVSKAPVSLDVIGRQRLFEPADIERLVDACPSDRFIDLKALIGVREDLEARAHRLTHRRYACNVLVNGASDFELAA